MVSAFGPAPTTEEKRKELTEAKLLVMRLEAQKFYSQYPGQTWKNVISIGDMKYERDALRAVTATRVSAQARERLRTKTLVLPNVPTLSVMTLWLRIFRLLLPALVQFDGDVDVDLSHKKGPIRTIATALNMPHLASVAFPQLELEGVASGISNSSLEEEDGPGAYRLLQDVVVKSAPRRGAPVHQLAQAGATVEVLEARNCLKQRCVWGRIASPEGWIVLVNQFGLRLADREEDRATEGALDEVAMVVQDSLTSREALVELVKSSPPR